MIETKRLIIREMVQSDYDALCGILCDEEPNLVQLKRKKQSFVIKNGFREPLDICTKYEFCEEVVVENIIVIPVDHFLLVLMCYPQCSHFCVIRQFDFVIAFRALY